MRMTPTSPNDTVYTSRQIAIAVIAFALQGVGMFTVIYHGGRALLVAVGVIGG